MPKFSATFVNEQGQDVVIDVEYARTTVNVTITRTTGEIGMLMTREEAAVVRRFLNPALVEPGYKSQS